MTAGAALPPIGGFILTGQLITRQAAHAPVILRHDLTTDYFGIEERARDWLDFRSFQVFPISETALERLCALLDEDLASRSTPGIPVSAGYPGRRCRPRSLWACQPVSALCS